MASILVVALPKAHSAPFRALKKKQIDLGAKIPEVRTQSSPSCCLPKEKVTASIDLYKIRFDRPLLLAAYLAPAAFIGF